MTKPSRQVNRRMQRDNAKKGVEIQKRKNRVDRETKDWLRKNKKMCFRLQSPWLNHHDYGRINVKLIRGVFQTGHIKPIVVVEIPADKKQIEVYVDELDISHEPLDEFGQHCWQDYGDSRLEHYQQQHNESEKK